MSCELLGVGYSSVLGDPRMILSLRSTWDWSSIRAWGPRRRVTHPIPFAVERLESRFLLAALGLDQMGSGPAQLAATTLSDPPIVATPVASDPGLAAALPVQSPAPADPGRIDSFELQAGRGKPEVRLELRWAGGSTPADGDLVVLDASGTIVFERSLVEVVAVQASITMPTGDPASTTPDTLDVGLSIRRGVDGSGDPGNYVLTMAWEPARTAIAPATVGVLTADPGQASSGMTVARPTPSLAVIGTLPAPDVSAQPPLVVAAALVIPGTPTPGFVTPPGGSTLAVPLDSPPIASAPGLLATAVFPSPLAIPATPTSGNHASSGQAGVTPTPGAESASTDRGRPTFVGPLPSGFSVPDGGIFARPFAGAASVQIGEAVGRQATTALLAPGVRAIPTRIDAESWTTAGSLGRDRTPFEWSPIAPEFPSRSISGRGGDAIASDPASVGVAFLPPIAWLSEPLHREHPAPKLEVHRPRSRGLRGNSVAAVLVALTSSAAMVLTLGGPERVMALRSARAARSSKRRAI